MGQNLLTIYIVAFSSECIDCTRLLGQAARAIQAHLEAMRRLEQAVLDSVEDISDEQAAFYDARESRMKAVEDYQFHCATHLAKYLTANSSAEPFG